MRGKYFVKCILAGGILFCGCTKLKEDFRGDITQGQIGADTSNAAILLQSLYNSLENLFTYHLTVFPLQELSTDEAIAPTRGQDWDDNGVWRALHQQKWLSNNSEVSQCFNNLNGIVFAATDILKYNPPPQEKAEARFIRALAMYLVLDLFDQVPYRDPGESLIQPARVRKGTDALNFIISEINEIEPSLPNGPVYKANKFAADVLLMKCFLNKAVYEKRSEPAFNPADMNKVINLADGIINSNTFSFSNNYFDNFAPNNGSIGKENIFTLQHTPGPENGLFLTWIIVCHYNQFFGAPANGWTTLSDFYKKFEPADKRRGMVYTDANAPPNPANGINIGFLKGQQFDYFTGDALKDGTGAPLIFTPEVKNIETGTNLQVTGIRPLKYFPDWSNLFSPGNDFVFLRLSDVLLMKAEAILRGGTGTMAGPYGNTAVSIVNFIRTSASRGASALVNVNLDNLIDERGRELWWEGWRRQDLIRFQKFLLPFQEKVYISDPKYLLFPIPADQVAVNKNLSQNAGY